MFETIQCIVSTFHVTDFTNIKYCNYKVIYVLKEYILCGRIDKTHNVNFAVIIKSLLCLERIVGEGEIELIRKCLPRSDYTRSIAQWTMPRMTPANMR